MKNWNYIEGAKTGNSNYRYKGYLITKSDEDGEIIVYKPNGRDVAFRGTKSESMAKDWIDHHEIGNEKTGAEEFFKKLSDDVKDREKKDDKEIEKVGNSLIGNSVFDMTDKDYENEYKLLITKRNNVQKGTSEYEKIQKRLEEIKKKLGRSPFGNSSVSGGTFKSDDGSQKAVIDVNPQSGTARVVWFENDRQNGSSDYRSIDLATAAVKRKGLKKVGNFKTGTSQLKPGDKVMSFGRKGTVKEVIGENTDNIYGEPLIKVEFEDGTTKTIGEHYMRKVGNKTTQVAQVGTVKIFYDDKDNVYYTNIGGSIFNNPSFKTKEEAVKYTVQKNKVGNSAPEYEILKQDPSKMHPAYKKAYEEALKKLSKEDDEFKKRFEREYGVKAKNDKSDDKFAYVMREFDAGKLKTPDGKVVTDPAQAKAIAYSESKKTENGLARARKAIK